MITVLRAFLVVAVFASFAACSGGLFNDPGHAESGLTGGSGGGGGGGGGGVKPGPLSDDASYEEFLAKVEAVTKYCTAHPGTENNLVKKQMDLTFSKVTSSTWNSPAQRILIIKQLTSLSTI
jgi:hypothetical protein